MVKQVYHSLQHAPLPENTTYYHGITKRPVLHLDHPALDALIDFHQQTPPTILANTPIEEALKIIKHHDIHLLLVIDTDDKIVGVVTAADMLGDKPVELVKVQKLRRADIKVAMVMTSTRNIQHINYATLSNAQVGHIVQTLISLSVDYLLVTEPNTQQGSQFIVRGLFLRSVLSRQINRDLSTVSAEAHSLAELKELHLENN